MSFDRFLVLLFLQGTVKYNCGEHKMVSKIRHTVYVSSLLFGVAVHHHHYMTPAQGGYMATALKKMSKTFCFLSEKFKHSGRLKDFIKLLKPLNVSHQKSELHLYKESCAFFFPHMYECCVNSQSIAPASQGC